MVTLTTLGILGAAMVAGVVGALLGLGGGIIVVPALTLLFDVPIHLAIGASIVGVIATSSGAASRYVRRGLTHMRLAMVLELATVVGALAGATFAGLASPRVLYLLFALLLVLAAASMLQGETADAGEAVPPGGLAEWLRLGGSYLDPQRGATVAYHAENVGGGLAVSFVAGVFSGLLGVGGGFLKVPAMHRLMGLPLKVSTATSSFMIGVTAASSAAVFFARGDVRPELAAPVALGVLAGATVGARLLSHLPARVIRWALLLVLAVVAVQMAVRGAR
ncbi:MAG TPA: sulfite exporter TauE/SafE family protein [Thermoanaerobaculaceae bacterium]|nr:sulfite exporter TauE/SafE family protein [Thermoanaerobaculaceae bacterium]HRS17623.1 sulfite exporter TauE/SafE family protein [Thermoanaerobaculaceae bacterium]